jgi:hypothetical protein
LRGRKSIFKTIKTERVPFFPELTSNKSSRVVTKHFTNLAMYLPADELALINWLIYQCRADNTFEYSQFLITKYSNTVVLANKEYTQVEGKHLHIKVSGQAVRDVLERLIRNGLVLASGKKKMMVSPMLTYRADYITTPEYSDICDMYGRLLADENDVDVFIKKYCGVINKKYDKTNKNTG